MARLVILALSGGGGVHQGNELAQAETWTRRLPADVSMFWIRGDGPLQETEIRAQDCLILTPVEESFENLLSKTVLSVRAALEHIEFDYLLRTNTSCYFEPSLLHQALDGLPARGVYRGVIGRFTLPRDYSRSQQESGWNFVSGSGIWLSRDTAEILAEVDADRFRGLIDDVAIGRHMRESGVGIQTIERLDVTDFAPLVPAVHTRVKHLSKGAVTTSRMRALESIYTAPPSELAEYLRRFDRMEQRRALRALRWHPAEAARTVARIELTHAQRLDAFRRHHQG